MARARNIKPGFFRNADLVELSFEARLLFVGLWTLADRSGRLEDRPKQIKMEIFPADSVDCNALLDDIAATGMLTRYTVDGKRYLQVVNFIKHQNPHRDEKASTIPNQCGQLDKSDKTEQHGANTVQAPCKQVGNTVVIGLNPDVLNPDPGFLIPETLGGERDPAPPPKPGQPSAIASPPPIFSIENQNFIKTERPDLNGPRVWLNFCDHYEPDKRTPANWRKWVRREMRGPVAGVDLAPAAAVSDPDSKASVETLGVAVGVGKWDQLREHWAAYKARVRAAAMEPVL